MPTDIDKLQGAWDIISLEIDGRSVPASTAPGSQLVITGNRFTSLAMGATYEGTIELGEMMTPRTVDLVFTAGPEKGNRNLGIYKLAGKRWTICLATLGTKRPSKFQTMAGTGIALETLERAEGESRKARTGTTLERAVRVGGRSRMAGTGTKLETVERVRGASRKAATRNPVSMRTDADRTGSETSLAGPVSFGPRDSSGASTTPLSSVASAEPVSSGASVVPVSSDAPTAQVSSATPTPLEGEWAMVTGVFSGVAMDQKMVEWCKRITRGDVTSVIAGPQVILEARFTLDPAKTPREIGYDNLAGANTGKKQAGIWAIEGDTLWVCMAAPGKRRPTEFASKSSDGRSFTTWRLAKR